MKETLKLTVQDNLYLELLSLKHANELFTLVNKNRTYLREFLPWLDSTKSIKDTKIFIEYFLKDYKKLSSLQLVIIFNNKLVGMLSLNDINKNNFSSCLGYWLASEHTKKGLMIKSVKTLISYSFKELNLNKLEIRCATKNYSSNNIPKKLSFKKDGILRDNEFLYDHFVDHNVYSLLKSEFLHSV